MEESEEERFDDSNDSSMLMELPPCELAKLEQMNEVSLQCYLLEQRFFLYACSKSEAYYVMTMHICFLIGFC